MSKKNEEFHDDPTFSNELVIIFKKIISDKLPAFLEFCIQTHNAEPLKEVIYLITVNQFSQNQ